MTDRRTKRFTHTEANNAMNLSYYLLGYVSLLICKKKQTQMLTKCYNLFIFRPSKFLIAMNAVVVVAVVVVLVAVTFQKYPTLC